MDLASRMQSASNRLTKVATRYGMTLALGATPTPLRRAVGGEVSSRRRAPQALIITLAVLVPWLALVVSRASFAGSVIASLVEESGMKFLRDAVGDEVVASVHYFGVSCVAGVWVDDGHPLALRWTGGPRRRQCPRLADAAEVKEPVLVVGDSLGAESRNQRTPLRRGVLAQRV